MPKLMWGFADAAISEQIITTYMQNVERIKTQTLGLSPDPWRKNVPVINQKLFDTENWFSTISESWWQGWGLFHSYGENRAITNKVKDTSIYAARTYNQISTAKGFIKLKSLVGWLVGTWKSVLLVALKCCLK